MKNDESLVTEARVYHLEEKQAKEIVQAFAPKISEREALAKMYEPLISQELSPELAAEASALRKKLVKVRTGIADIHKTQKEFFLAAGRFVDAWKNKETAPILQMEENLRKIEEYQERLIEEQKKKVRAERGAYIEKYGGDKNAMDWAEVPREVWKTYALSVKTQYEERLQREAEAEQARIEAEAAEKARIAAQEAENKRLRAEAERLQRERDAAEKEREKQLAEERRVQRIKDEAAEKERQAIKAKLEAAEAEKRRLEMEKWDKEQAEKRKIEQEKAQAEVEKKRKEAEERRLKAAPVKERLKKWIDNAQLPTADFTDIDDPDEYALILEISENFLKFKGWSNGKIDKFFG